MKTEVVRPGIKAASTWALRPAAVVVVEGRQKGEASFEDALDEVLALMKKGRGRKEAVKIISEQYGLSKNELYEKSLLET